MTHTRSWPLLATVVMLCLALTGCGGNDSEADSAQAEPSDAAATLDRVAPAGLPEAPKLSGGAGAVSDLELGDCPLAEGEQPVSGTLTGSGKKSRDYVVVVSWINEHSDVRGRTVVVEKSLAPGESRDWKTTASVAPGATECVPNVQAGTLRGD